LSFPTTTIGETSEQWLTVSNYSYNSYLLITFGTLAPPFTVYYTGSYYISPRTGRQFPIGYTPTQTAPVTQYLTITSNDPNHPSMSVQINGGGGIQPARVNRSRAHHPK